MKITDYLLLGCFLLGSVSIKAQMREEYAFRDSNLPVEVRVKDLIAHLTLDEKVQLMKHNSPAIPHSGIPTYNWWNEALYGVARTPEKWNSSLVAVNPVCYGRASETANNRSTLSSILILP